jgi:hypothetical protein
VIKFVSNLRQVGGFLRELALLKDYYYQLYVLYMLGLTDAEHCERHDMKPDTNVNQGRAFSNKT